MNDADKQAMIAAYAGLVGVRVDQAEVMFTPPMTDAALVFQGVWLAGQRYGMEQARRILADSIIRARNEYDDGYNAGLRHLDYLLVTASCL